MKKNLQIAVKVFACALVFISGMKSTPAAAISSLPQAVLAEINIKGNGVVITQGSATASEENHTDFGSVDKNGGFISRTFVIENLGTEDLILTGMTLVNISGPNALDFFVSADPASTIPPNSSTSFSIMFDPSATGIHTATVSIPNNDEDENPFTFLIQGTGAAPEINVKGNGIDISNEDETPSLSDYTNFGAQDITSGTIERTFIIQNNGNSNLILTGDPLIEISGERAYDFTVIQEPATTISANGFSEFIIAFDPSDVGTRSAMIYIENNDEDEDLYTFAIQGTGTDINPEINIQGNGVDIANGDATPDIADNTDFGMASIIGSGVTRTFTIKNDGSSNLNLSGSPVISISGANAEYFSVTAMPSAAIGANSSQTFTIKFMPTISGLQTAVISIASNDADEGVYTFAIQGTGFLPTNINYLKNGGFNLYPPDSNLPMYWENINLKFEDGKDPEIRKEGMFSLKIKGASRYGQATTKVSTQRLTRLYGNAGELFTLQFYVSGFEVPELGHCYVLASFGNSSTGKSFARSINCPAGTYDFTFKRIKFKAPMSYDRVLVRIVYMKPGGTIWFDAMKLIR